MSRQRPRRQGRQQVLVIQERPEGLPRRAPAGGRSDAARRSARPPYARTAHAARHGHGGPAPSAVCGAPERGSRRSNSTVDSMPLDPLTEQLLVIEAREQRRAALEAIARRGRRCTRTPRVGQPLEASSPRAALRERRAAPDPAESGADHDGVGRLTAIARRPGRAPDPPHQRAPRGPRQGAREVARHERAMGRRDRSRPPGAVLRHRGEAGLRAMTRSRSTSPASQTRLNQQKVRPDMKRALHRALPLRRA